ncbi:MAG: family 78 glycoside hydrolase catalytic domain, partial [Bacteroidota bacterium]
MKKLRSLLSILIIANISLNAQLNPVQLTCEYLKNPPVVDVLQPRLSWINMAGEGARGELQTAWQIRVAGSKENLDQSDLWDSGKIPSDRSTRVKYEGNPLTSRQECWWQVRVWDRDNKASDWSEPAMWRMGILQQDEWLAKWIGAPWQGEEAMPRPQGGRDDEPEDFGPPAPLLRRTFPVDKEITSAVAFVTGLGYFELWLNGKKVGEDLLVPNQTNYGKRPGLTESLLPLEDNFREYRVMYLAYDIIEQLKRGENAIGGILGNGFYNPARHWAEGYGSPRFLCQVHITYSDGTEEVIVSDQSWKAARGPIMMDMVYYGEHYDARKEQPGWCSAGFDETGWEPVKIRRAPEGKLVAHTVLPDRVTEQIQPLSIKKMENGNYYVDFGVEISGWVRLNRVEGPEGHKIKITFDSNEYSGENTYIFGGKGPESYAPRFNWFVFSGVEIADWPGELKPEHLTAEAVNTDVEISATFHTSNPLFNDINRIWRRSQTDNMHGGIASDCPHRERSAYTGDGQVVCNTVMHNFDARSFYQKWTKDILGAQNMETGYVPNGAPWQPGCGGGVAWGAAICVMPWEFYVQYGARDMLEDNYEGMKGYLRYMRRWVDEEGIMFSQRTGLDGKPLYWFNLGEWIAPGETVPDEMMHTFYYWYCAKITAQTAKILEIEHEAETYEALANNTREAFQKRFYDHTQGTYGNGGGNILALKMGVPDQQLERVITALRSNIEANKGHHDTGIFGTRFFFEMLAENGMQDLAYEALNKTSQPSIGHWVEIGSTTTRESWDEQGSHNHPMFGGGLVWFYRNLAGMQADPESPGYRHIVFRPQPVDQLNQVTYTNITPYGEAGITWKNEAQSFSMNVTVPVSCQATVCVPAQNPEDVYENGKKHEEAPGLEFIGVEDGYVVFKTGSGNY